jgi:hypothetical protein
MGVAQIAVMKFLMMWLQVIVVLIVVMYSVHTNNAMINKLLTNAGILA